MKSFYLHAFCGDRYVTRRIVMSIRKHGKKTLINVENCK